MASVSSKVWSSKDGRESRLFSLKTNSGYQADILEHGATVVGLLTPDREGVFGDIVLGHDNLDDYLANGVFLGATVGRVANRVAHGQFQLNGRTHKLALTDPPHHLHGGKLGWDKVNWSGSGDANEEQAWVELSYDCADGEEGYPGRVQAQVRYTLSEDGELDIAMTATADALTVVNMAHHSYFNLSAGASPNIEDHQLTLDCDEFTPGIVPNGETRSVQGSAYDFRSARRLGDAIPLCPGPPKGLDQNLVVRGNPHEMRSVAFVVDPLSGRTMSLSANQPGVQLYTGNYLDGSRTGKGVNHGQHGAFCLEPQAFPNAVNVEEWREQVLLAPGKRYDHRVMLKFSTR